MFIFKEHGRLGNQIFQYSALRTLCKQNEKLILLGFEDLQATFDNVDAKLVNSNSTRADFFLYRQAYIALNLLAKNRIVNSVSESKPGIKKGILYTPGMLKSINFVEESYFQWEYSFSPSAISSLSLKLSLEQFAKKLISEVSGSSPCFFVHIRRGDYTHWPSSEHPAVLPLKYYRYCINLVRDSIPDAFMIFVSDDPFYVEDFFGDMKNAYISRHSSLKDFALITQCCGGILSASSFSWWGAYLSHRKNFRRCFLAPEHWLRHRAHSWDPPAIKSSFLTYVEADSYRV